MQSLNSVRNKILRDIEKIAKDIEENSSPGKFVNENNMFDVMQSDAKAIKRLVTILLNM